MSLRASLQLGLEFYVPEPSARLPTVTTVKVPTGVEWAKVTGECPQPVMPGGNTCLWAYNNHSSGRPNMTVL